MSSLVCNNCSRESCGTVWYDHKRNKWKHGAHRDPECTKPAPYQFPAVGKRKR